MKEKRRGLQIRMLGGFSMYYGDKRIEINKLGSSKLTRLLQMLLLSGDSGISKNELIDNLYGWNGNTDMVNHNKNINNLIYRLRKQLVFCGLPEDEYVQIQEGICYFKISIPTSLDTVEFEQTVEKAEQHQGIERFRLFCQANEIYCDQLLPANQSETWFYQKGNHLKKLYLETIKALDEEYKTSGNYRNRLDLYSKAAAIYPFENWQVQVIRCNLEMRRYEAALKVYNDTMELYAKELGSAPVEELQKCFENTELLETGHRGDKKGIHNRESLDKIFLARKQDIWRELFEEGSEKGAYYCTYPSFVDYCHMVLRAKERNDFSAVLMFLTLSWKGRKEGIKQTSHQKEMDILKTAIGNSLRTGDAYTRYGSRHFILMLLNTELEFCNSIFVRIESAYKEKSGKEELWYYADMTQELKSADL